MESNGPGSLLIALLSTIYREYLASDLPAPASKPLTMPVVGAEFEGSTVQVTASFRDILNRSWPEISMIERFQHWRYRDGGRGDGFDHMSRELLIHLDAARHMAGGIPFVINSAYRCEKHNADVGGVRTFSV